MMTPSASRTGRTLLLVAIAASTLAATQATRFRSGVDLVQLQVGVADADGGFPAGLTPADFVLRINGEVRPVQVAFGVDLRDPGQAGDAAAGAAAGGAPAPASAAGTPPTVLPAAARRHFLIFFDLSFTTRRGLLEARRSALQFVDVQADPSDLIGVATANRFGIELLAPFTADRDVVRRAVAGLGLEAATDAVSEGTGFEESIGAAISELGGTRAGGGGSLDEGVLEAANLRALEGDVINYQSQLQAFGEMLQAIGGRKHVLFFSRGFSDRLLVGSGGGGRAAAPESLYGSAAVREGMTDMVDTLQRADAAVHAIDTSGLAGGGGRQSLTQLAVDTGGNPYFNRSDFTAALAAIEEQTSAYYMLGYAKSADDPPTVEVEVRVGLPGVRVVSAPRLLSPPPDYAEMNAAQRQLQVAEALNDSSDRPGILFDSSVVPFPTTRTSTLAAMLVEVPGAEIDRLAALRGDGRVELEVVAVALDDADRIVAERRRGVGVTVADLRADGSSQAQTLRFSDMLEVPTGSLRVRLLLREAQIGLLSARTMRTWVPSDEGMRVARPLVVASIEPAAEAGAGEFDPLRFEDRGLSIAVLPTLRPRERVRVLVSATGLSRDPATGATTAGLGLEIVDADGAPHTLSGWTMLGATYDGDHDLTRLLVELQMPANLPTGRAQLWARFVDRDAGRRAEEQVGILVQGL